MKTIGWTLLQVSLAMGMALAGVASGEAPAPDGCGGARKLAGRRV